MKEFFEKIKSKLKSLIPFRKVNPHVYWNNLLYIFFLIVIILILFSFYILYEIKNQQVLQIAPMSQDVPSLINEKLLDKVNESFNNNSIKEKEIKNDIKSYRDPSLN